MARCDVNEARAAQIRFAQLEAFFVQRDVRNVCAQRLEDGGCADISGIFHADPIAGIEKKAGDEIECFLSAGDDGYLFECAIHAARSVEVIRDCFAERQVAERFAAHQKICGDFAETPGGDLRP